ncbi:MAG TPA: hypothetical protein PLW02_02200 [Verrucomicrobiota bacterium]|mgnify:CR=1 FL=1|nr:hypothetical protein [Verrucomicrobiota bacterium]
MRLGFTLEKMIFLAAIALLTGCGKEDIKVYKIPKESAVAKPHQQPQEQWKVVGDVPQNWEEKGPSGMRIAQYVVRGKDNSQGEVAVMPMVGLRANKNEILAIWKGQLGQDVVEKSEKVKIGEDEGELFDLSSKQQQSPELPQRILVAMLIKDNVNWFFRISGASNLVEQSKSDFIKYLNSIKIIKASQHQTEAITKPNTSANIPSTNIKSDFKTNEQIRMVGIIASAGSYAMFFKITNSAVERHKDELNLLNRSGFKNVAG